MKRLTIRTNDRVILAVERQPSGEPLHSRIRDLQRAANERLAAYEDTGLTPEEISDIAAREDNVQEVNDRMEERCKTLSDKHWDECRQIALYQNELSQALDLLSECYGALNALGKLAPSLPRDVQDYIEEVCIRIDSLREETSRTTEVPADE